MEEKIFIHFKSELRAYRKVDIKEDLPKIFERQLPKILYNEEAKLVIKIVDKILEEEIKKKPTFENLHTMVYCGAKTAIQFCQKCPQLPKSFPKSAEEQTRLFVQSPKTFHHLLQDETFEENPKIPESEKYHFWAQIWQNGPKIKKSSRFINQEKSRICTRMEKTVITVKDLHKIFRKMKNWSPPGIDGLQTFWYKKFSSIHSSLVDCINNVINSPETMPKFFTRGLTRLVPKLQTVESASDFRPMTHLPSIYKIISKAIALKIFQYYSTNQILAEEQMGDRPSCHGNRKIHAIDSIAMAQKEVFGVYIDYKKALDKISHCWVLEVLEVYGVDTTLINFMESALKQWRIKLLLERGEFEDIVVRRGLFQGDPISTLLYWTAVNPLSFLLKRGGVGLKLTNGGVISHVSYMDDLKLFAGNFDDLTKLFEIFSDFSDHIQMEISLEKSYVFALANGRRVEGIQPLFANGVKVKVLDSDKPTFLGYQQKPTTQHPDNVQMKISSFLGKIRKIFDTELPQDQKVAAVNYYFNAKLAKSFSIIRWGKRDIKYLGEGLSKIFKVKKKVIRQRIHLKVIEDVWKMRNYFQNEKSRLAEVIVRNDNGITPLNLSTEKIGISFDLSCLSYLLTNENFVN